MDSSAPAAASACSTAVAGSPRSKASAAACVRPECGRTKPWDIDSDTRLASERCGLAHDDPSGCGDQRQSGVSSAQPSRRSHPHNCDVIAAAWPCG